MKEVHIRKRELKSGVVYEYRFEIDEKDGKRQFISKSGFKTKTEAKEAGKKAQREYEEKGAEPNTADITVEQLLLLWLPNADVKLTTKAHHEMCIRNFIIPYIGDIKAASVDYKLLQEKIVNYLYDRGINNQTITDVIGTLSRAYEYAEINFGIKKNFESLKIPKNRVRKEAVNKRPHIFITPEQIKEIFKRFPEGTPQYLPLLLGYSCGFRISETFALTWEDINFEDKTVTVNKQVQWFKVTPYGTVGQGGTRLKDFLYGYWYFDEPKYGSARVVDILDDHIIEVLKREKVRQQKAKEYYSGLDMLYDSDGKPLKAPYTEYYLSTYEGKTIITEETTDKPVHLLLVREDGTYINPRTMNRATSVIKYQLGIKGFDYHSLRHTHATMLCNRIDENEFDDTGKKLSPVFAQKRLGHKSIQTTLDLYYHLTEEKRREEALRISDMYSDLFDEKKENPT